MKAAIRPAIFLTKARNLARCACFCSASAGSSDRRRCFFSDEEEGESAVYKHAMKFQRPSVLKWSSKLERLENQVNLIGSVYWPVRVYEWKDNPFCAGFIATTDLEVKVSRDSSTCFRIRLGMVGEIARMCSQHLKKGDFIYVSGQLERFVDYKSVKQYKVVVKELNYVARPAEISASPSFNQSESRGGTPLEKLKSRLYLWQLFFANPQEWWDNRKNKKNPKAPDFKHKDTGEVLWISPNDPQWVATQLQLYDLRMADYGHMRSHYSGTKHGLSKWSPDGLI